MAKAPSKERRLFLKQKMAEAAKPDPMAAAQWNAGVKATPAKPNSDIPLDRYIGIDTKVLFPPNVYMPTSTVQNPPQTWRLNKNGNYVSGLIPVGQSIIYDGVKFTGIGVSFGQWYGEMDISKGGGWVNP